MYDLHLHFATASLLSKSNYLRVFTYSPNDPGPGLTLRCSGLLDPISAPSTPSLPRKQVENKLGESRLEATSSSGS